jgi:hypothetical protein
MLVCFYAMKVDGQAKQPLLFQISLLKSDEPNYEWYNVILLNSSDSPMCILHSDKILLFDNAKHRLAVRVWDPEKDTYNLTHVARDTLITYEVHDANYSGEVILPYRKIEINLLIPKSGEKKRYLEFEYFFAPDYCYRHFTARMEAEPIKWHREFKKFTVQYALPK